MGRVGRRRVTGERLVAVLVEGILAGVGEAQAAEAWWEAMLFALVALGI
jgi:hypothetical protein